MRGAPAEQRRAIYDRARQALLGQLRTMQPPVPEESILRESTALDEAIARVEADLVTPAAPAATESSAPGGPPPSPPDGAPVPPPSAPPASSSETPADVAAIGTDAAPMQPARIVAASAPSSPAIAPPAATAVPVKAPSLVSRPAPARPAADALTRIVAERGAVPPPLRATRGETETPDPVTRAGPLPTAPRLQVPSFDDALVGAEAAAAAAAADGASDATDDAARSIPPREEVARPPAPRPVVRERFNPRFLILTLVGLLVVAGIGYAAWRLRDKPEALARSRAAMLAAQQAEQQNTKVSTRIGAAGASATATQTAPPAADATAATVPSPAASSDAVSPAPPIAASAPQPAPSDATSAAPASPVADPGPGPVLPVTQRAAFLVDAPDDPAKVKTFVGTVVWSTESATSGANQQLTRTVHADVDVPEAALKMSMVFQKNDEAQFPASHTFELRFTLLPGNTLGPIKQINVPQMRKDDSQTGDALIGLPVAITDNYFLVGLTRGEATQRNLDYIKTRNWFDIPILLASGRVAKITFEKGDPGQKAIDEVMQSWQ